MIHERDSPVDQLISSIVLDDLAGAKLKEYFSREITLLY